MRVDAGEDGIAGRARVRRRVERGKVECPRRGLVDVTVCFACPLSLGLSSDRDERIVCVWESYSEPDSGRT
jgi:hypothetical protein